MESVDTNELMESASDFFKEGDYKRAEPLLQQAILRNNRLPEVFQMLGTIYYDQGKFTKAINSFKRALEIDPTFTDASIGLSIILNDLGRYEEGKKVFTDAQAVLSKNKVQSDPFANETFASKHMELGDLYLQHQRHDEALEQYYKCQRLTLQKADVGMKIADVFVLKQDPKNAIRELKNLVRDNPALMPAKILLGKIQFDAKLVGDAMDTWDSILLRDPMNREVKELMDRARRTQYTHKDL
jgi:tetratricopeptide (TPR) repeat protein